MKAVPEQRRIFTNDTRNDQVSSPLIGVNIPTRLQIQHFAMLSHNHKAL